ncbi:unnamed protein product [Callosobruchus maculatus]|uniref:Uncharacterized protein n=1 Tax=Callosobruchus maculatus TaxID=64391 RepID=A0A653BQM4_CALMS|nr:unnamed protein product [Callosobruchus maculatus]
MAFCPTIYSEKKILLHTKTKI